MCLYPEAQKKAQAELDNVLGGRLPEFNDRPNLPYVNALMKESMRWQQVTPLGSYFPWSPCMKIPLICRDLGVVHSSSEADEYNGYYIPKGTIVIGNAWYTPPPSSLT